MQTESFYEGTDYVNGTEQISGSDYLSSAEYHALHEVSESVEIRQGAEKKHKTTRWKLKMNEKSLMLLALLSVLLLIIAAGLFAFYQMTHYRVYGQQIDIFAEDIQLNGKNIQDLDSLKSYLKKFKNLKRVDLGSFKVQAEDSVPFRQSFPNTELIYDTVVSIEGKDYDTDITSLDISDRGFSDCKAFMQKLDFLPDLKTVIFGNITIPVTEKKLLESAFPDVSFEVIGTYEIYGRNVPENTEELDLRDVPLDASLTDQLGLLTQLRTVDMHEQPLSKNERIQLAQQFPDVSFGWTVKYRDESYDSSITELDLSGEHMDIGELPELKEVCEMLPDLEILDLSDCGLGYETLADFREEMEDTGVKVVWKVYLGSRWALKTNAVAFSVLIVHYDYPRMTSNDLDVLKYCPDLLALDLGHQAITDISPICDNLPNLRLLILADNRISDISPLTKLTHLHYIELFLNRINDISPLGKLKELVDVNISYNAISNIEPLLNSPMLSRVWMESTYVGVNGKAMIEEKYPDCKVVIYGSGSVDQGWRWGHPRYEQMMDMWFHDYYGDEFQKFDDMAEELGLR